MKNESKQTDLEILKILIESEIQMANFDGDDHPAVFGHRKLLAQLIGEDEARNIVNEIAENGDFNRIEEYCQKFPIKQ